jgi:hypothetical protein
MQGRDGHGSSTRRRGFTPLRLLHPRRSAVLASMVASAGLALYVAGAMASGSAQGPPAGPKSAPFTQCPRIGVDTSCEYLIDVTSTDPTVRPTVVRDATQHFYDGEDDVTVGVQNDTGSPLGSIHVGVAESGDRLFAFDGDGLCWSSLSPRPSECPFSSTTYDGPDTTLTAESPDAGTVFFNAPLQPGQYTYFALEAAPAEGIVSGELDDVVSTTLTNTETLATGDSLSAARPAAVTDKATIKGASAAKATGTVEYVLYSDASCQKIVETLGKKNVEGGVAGASNPSSRELHTNATYYWVAKYSGDPHNSANSSACGSETMTFGTPPVLPQPTITTVLSGAGQHGPHITVEEGVAVTDTAIIAAPGGQPVTGRVSYAAYASASCTGTAVAGLGGGTTTGIGPSTTPVTLGAGKYYFQAFYSGSPQLKSAATLCGDEVLTVLAHPPLRKAPGGSPRRPPSSQFNVVGHARVNEKTGAILITVRVPAAGIVTANGVIKRGAELARVRRDDAAAAKRKKCRRGSIRKHGRCTSTGPVPFGAATLTASAAGTYTIAIRPSQRVLAALRHGKKLHVTVSVTFRYRAGGARITHLDSVLVRIKKPGHRKH